MSSRERENAAALGSFAVGVWILPVGISSLCGVSSFSPDFGQTALGSILISYLQAASTQRTSAGLHEQAKVENRKGQRAE